MADAPGTSSRQRWTLLLVCTAAFMLLLDITVVSVALPSIQRDLRASLPDLQWVSAAYALVLAVLLPASPSTSATCYIREHRQQVLRATGATGLEPANSGVTGPYSQRYMGDDRFVIPLIASVLGPTARAPHGCIGWSTPFAACLQPDAPLLRVGG